MGALKESFFNKCIDLSKRMGDMDSFEIYESIGNNISFSVKKEASLLEEGIDWEIPSEKKGGIITLSTDVNAISLDDNKIINKIKQFFTTWKQRLSHREMIDKIAQKHNLVGWTIGHFLDGRYTAKNGKTFGENSLSIECVGIDSNTLLDIAKDLCEEFNQETVMVKDYSNGKIMFINTL